MIDNHETSAERRAKGALKRVGGESTTASQTVEHTMTRRGSEGYERECAQKEKEWFEARMQTAEPYGE